MAQKISADEIAARTARLSEVCDEIADRLHVDPERIMFDAPNNHVCLPVSLAVELLSLAERTP